MDHGAGIRDSCWILSYDHLSRLSCAVSQLGGKHLKEEEKNVHRVGDFRKEHQGFGFITVDGAIAVLPTPTFQLATSGQLVR